SQEARIDEREVGAAREERRLVARPALRRPSRRGAGESGRQDQRGELAHGGPRRCGSRGLLCASLRRASETGDMSGAPEAIVAGHVCLDLTPRFPDAGPFDFAARVRPGALVEVGELAFTAGGAVANTGLALARLGVETGLVARVGDDPLAA